ncbi:ESPR-type extended signal peptide-containing protein, partial [Mitsuokella multacida]
MNRIYKVIWSAVRNTYVAVAETTHAHGKAHSTKQQIFAALAAGVLVAGEISGSAYAAEGKVLAGSSTNVASGEDASVSGGISNKALGTYASVSGGSSNTASGGDATVSGGSDNTASRYYATV